MRPNETQGTVWSEQGQKRARTTGQWRRRAAILMTILASSGEDMRVYAVKEADQRVNYRYIPEPADDVYAVFAACYVESSCSPSMPRCVLHVEHREVSECASLIKRS